MTTGVDATGKLTYSEAAMRYYRLSAVEKLGTGTFWAQASSNAVTRGALASAQGGKFATGMVGGFTGTMLSSTAQIIGDVTGEGFSLENVLLHTGLGCVGALAAGDKCAAGAIGGGVSAAVSPWVGKAFSESGPRTPVEKTITAVASVTAGMGVAAALGYDHLPAGQAAQNEVMNNFLNHLDKSERDTLRRKRLNGETLTREENIRLVALEGADQMSDGLLEKYRKGGIEALSQKERDDLAIYLGAYQKVEGDQATRNLILNGPNPSYGYPYAGTRQMQAAYMARMRDQKDGSWDKFWFSPGETANHAAYNQARIDSGLFMNTHPNESFLPSQQALSGIFGDIDAIQNSALAAIGYLGATTLNADPLTRSQFTQMLSNLSDVGASFLLPRISLTPGGAFGVTSVTPQSRVDSLEVGGGSTLSRADFPGIRTKVSQKQMRHIAGRPELKARNRGGYFNSISDAQAVLDAFHSGRAKILGKTAQGFPIVKVDGVVGTNVNNGVGILSQPTSVFIIKGTASPSVVPTDPNRIKE